MKTPPAHLRLRQHQLLQHRCRLRCEVQRPRLLHLHNSTYRGASHAAVMRGATALSGPAKGQPRLQTAVPPSASDQQLAPRGQARPLVTSGPPSGRPRHAGRHTFPPTPAGQAEGKPLGHGNCSACIDGCPFKSTAL